MPSIRFLGAAGTVTGSCFLVAAHGRRVLVDALPAPPRRVLCVHGEPSALAATADRLRAQGWPVQVPRYLEEVDLAA